MNSLSVKAEFCNFVGQSDLESQGHKFLEKVKKTFGSFKANLTLNDQGQGHQTFM